MTRKKPTKKTEQPKRVIKIITVPLDDLIEQDSKNDCLIVPPVGLYYYDKTTDQTLRFSVSAVELALLQMVFLDPVLMKHMDAGRLYDFGMGKVGGHCSPNYIVKLYMDDKTILTEYDRNYSGLGNDKAVCLIVPAELTLKWMED